MPQETLYNCDVVLQGTSEDTLVELINDYKNKKIWNHRKKKGYLFNDLPFPDRGFIEKEKVVNNLHFEKYGNVIGTGAYFSRGCSFNCRFCVYNNPSTFEYSSFEKITNEIEYLKKIMVLKVLI